MTLWELAACADGVSRANGGGDPVTAPGEEEYRALLARHSAFVEGGR